MNLKRSPRIKIFSLFKGLKKRIRGELNDDIVTAFLDVSDVDMQKGTISEFKSSDLAYRESAEKIIVSCRRMKSCRTKGELLFILGEEVMQYSLKDPEEMYANFERKTRNISGTYRNKLLPKVHEQIFEAHHSLLLLYRQNIFEGMEKHLNLRYYDYYDMVAESCSVKARLNDPRILYLKYLLAAFTMFVCDKPAHPTGTPFPGGQTIDKWDGVYYCPVRDKADDVPFSLCPFCPTVQSDEPIYPWSGSVRRKEEKQECLENYRTNFKG